MLSEKIISTLAVATIGLVGCTSRPEMREIKDFTGDGIPDALVHVSSWDAKTRGNYLFIGQENGSFVRAKKLKVGKNEYFMTDGGAIYFFDGEIYKPASEYKQE